MCKCKNLNFSLLITHNFNITSYIILICSIHKDSFSIDLPLINPCAEICFGLLPRELLSLLWGNYRQCFSPSRTVIKSQKNKKFWRSQDRSERGNGKKKTCQITFWVFFLCSLFVNLYHFFSYPSQISFSCLLVNIDEYKNFVV